MPYTIVRDGSAQIRWLRGARPFIDLLTRAEIEQVERCSLVGVNFRGDVLDLSSPLEEGSTVTLRAPDPARDFAAIGVPINKRGDMVGVVDYECAVMHEVMNGDLAICEASLHEYDPPAGSIVRVWLDWNGSRDPADGDIVVIEHEVIEHDGVRIGRTWPYPREHLTLWPVFRRKAAAAVW